MLRNPRCATAGFGLLLLLSCSSRPDRVTGSAGRGAAAGTGGGEIGAGGQGGGVGGSTSGGEGGSSGTSGSNAGEVGGSGGSGVSGSGGSAASSSGGSGATAGGDEGGASACAASRADTWTALPTDDEPSARDVAWVIPIEDGVLIFGGLVTGAADPFLDDGAIYRLCDDAWAPTSTDGVPHAITDTVAHRPTGTWTGSELLVWGGVPGGTSYQEGEPVSFAARYDSTTDTWSDMNRTGGPTSADEDVVVWTGERLLVWGGVALGESGFANHDDGALYDPKTDSWAPMSVSGAPPGGYEKGRYVWTGDKLVVWGGLQEAGTGSSPKYTTLQEGAVYDPAQDSWTPASTDGAPSATLAPLVWTGTRLIALEMLDGYSTPGQVKFAGGLFDPASNHWTPMSPPDLALADGFENAQQWVVWTGSQLAVFGTGGTDSGFATISLLYDPQSDTWSSADGPNGLGYYDIRTVAAVGGKVVVSGIGPTTKDARGADHASTLVSVLDPATRTWSDLPLIENRTQPSVVALPGHVIVWGGYDIYTDLDAPNPCIGSTGPCDPVTPMVRDHLGDGVRIDL